MKITITVPADTARLLQVLCDEDRPELADVIELLCDHAQQGVYRPGAWERGWLEQVFGEDFHERLIPGDPYGRPGCEQIFEKPAGADKFAHAGVKKLPDR